MPEQMPQFNTLQEGNLEKVRIDPIALYLEQLNASQEFGEIFPQVVDLSFMSREQKAETLWALFQEVKRGVNASKVHKRNETVQQQVSELAGSISLLKALYADEDVRVTYLQANQHHLQEVKGINGDWEKYKALQQQIHEAMSAVDVTAKKIFSSRGASLSESDAILFEVNRRRLMALRQELAVVISENPQLAAYAQYDNLREYSQELASDGFLWLPSRRAALEEMETAALGGKPVLLSGESGTGKTRLVEEVAMTLTGRPVNQTPGKDVRFQDLIAKRDIAADGTLMNTYYRYAEIGEAVTGKATTLEQKPSHAGSIVADDEFNLLPAAEQTERLARIAAWTPGKRIKMPVTNEDVVVGSHFLYTAMVNLASERYSRTKIPPEVLRKFAKVDLDYLKQTDEEPELYEAMLSALMDDNGRLRAATSEVAPQFEDREELETVFESGQEVKRTVRLRELCQEKVDAAGRTMPAGAFLWRFAGAINEINKSYSHRETVLKVKGEGQFVKDLIIDIGSLVNWLKEYRTIGYSQNLESFVISKLDKEFLSKQAYSVEDRVLVKEFFRHFGIDVSPAGIEQAAIAEHQFENLTPVELGKFSPRVHYKELVSEEPVLTESYLINAEGERVEYRLAPYAEGSRQLTPGQVIQAKSDGEFVQYRGLAKKTGDPIFVPYKPHVIESRPSKTSFEIELIATEKQSLEAFFGQVIDIPPIPAEITKEKIAHWESLGFKLRYLPAMDMSKSQNYPGWKTKPETWFYEQITKGNLVANGQTLTAGWVLVDASPKPAYDNGEQMYKDDPFATAITKLRQAGVIEDYKLPGSRFNISADELAKPELKIALAKVLAIDPAQLSYLRAIEFNILGNAFYPEWGETDTWEWFEDQGIKDLSGRRLGGGDSGSGGLSRVSYDSSGGRCDYLGFRPLVRFS